MNAADVMTRRVVTIHPETPVVEAVHVMLQNDMSGLPVVDKEGTLVGIVTEGDFLRRAELGTARKHRRWLELFIGPLRLADEYVHTHAKKVREVMTREVVTVGPDTPLGEIVAAMERHRVKRIPVTRDGKLVGIVSRANLLRALGSLATSPELSGHSGASDAALREQILAEFDKQAWSRAGIVEVVVWDGSAHLWGTITDDKLRAAFRVAAEGVPGVKDVTDHLVLLEPHSEGGYSL